MTQLLHQLLLTILLAWLTLMLLVSPRGHTKPAEITGFSLELAMYAIIGSPLRLLVARLIHTHELHTGAAIRNLRARAPHLTMLIIK